MKRPFRLLAIAVVLATTFGMLSACDDDDDNPMDPAPTTGVVAGTVTFEGTWPTTGDVQISIFSSWPPMGPPDAFTDPIAPGASYDYRIEGLDPGTYAGIVVGWRDPANPSAAEILGMYWAFVDSVATGSDMPLPVTVVAGETESNLDVTADLDVAP